MSKELNNADIAKVLQAGLRKAPTAPTTVNKGSGLVRIAEALNKQQQEQEQDTNE